jgi:hypothetical protein
MNGVPRAGWCSGVPGAGQVDVNPQWSQLHVQSKLQERSQVLLGPMIIRGDWPSLHHIWSRSPGS